MKEFIGFENIINGFMKRADNNTLSHAHLIVGPDGIGKSILAKINLINNTSSIKLEKIIL